MSQFHCGIFQNIRAIAQHLFGYYIQITFRMLNVFSGVTNFIFSEKTPMEGLEQLKDRIGAKDLGTV